MELLHVKIKSNLFAKILHIGKGIGNMFSQYLSSFH